MAGWKTKAKQEGDQSHVFQTGFLRIASHDINTFMLGIRANIYEIEVWAAGENVCIGELGKYVRLPLKRQQEKYLHIKWNGFL